MKQLHKTYRQHILLNFLTSSNSVGHQIPTHPNMLEELRKYTVPCSEPIEFCLQLFIIKAPIRTGIQFSNQFVPSGLLKNTIWHVPFNALLHHNIYKQLFHLWRLQFLVFSIIQSSCHLIIIYIYVMLINQIHYINLENL